MSMGCGLPHRFFGLALADLLVPTQTTKTSLRRALLDNIYLQGNGRYFAVEGQVNIDDLLVSRPGGIVRIKQPGAVGPLNQGQADLGGILSTLEYEEVQKENASGWTRYSQGTSADALNKTATGTSIITNRSDARVELMARNMAEGIKAMFLGVLKLVCQYQDKAAVVRLNNQWVNVDPREWKTQFDLAVNVGIGTGSKDAQTQKLMALHQMQVQALQIGYATPKNLFNGAKAIAASMGEKRPEEFFTDPEQMPPKPSGPPPEVMVEQMRAQSQMQAKQLELQASAQAKQIELAETTKLEQIKAQIEAIRVQQESQLKQYIAQLEAQTKLAVAEIGKREVKVADDMAEAESQANAAALTQMLANGNANLQALLQSHAQHQQQLVDAMTQSNQMLA